MLNVLHTIAGLHPDSGGPARTVTSLVDNLCRIDSISVVLATQSLNGDEVYVGPLCDDRVAIASSSSLLSLKLGVPLYNNLSNLISDSPPAIVHDHGIWLPANHIVAKIAAKKNIPRVVHTRGMLEPWALSYRAYKKKLAWSIYQKADLESVSLFFATAESEAANLRALGFKQPIAVIPNGVDLPEHDIQAMPGTSLERLRNVVFMSRIHPKKGLMQLMAAWAKIRPTGWRLVLAGPNDGDHLQEVLALVQKLGLEDQVEYRGVVEGEEKAQLLKSADLFILPSFSENFGVVVAEALAHGVPVISTLGTPWQGLVENKCGWWIPSDPEAIALALKDGMALDDTERRNMGMRAQVYADSFNWQKIAIETANVYRWLLGEGDLPESITQV